MSARFWILTIPLDDWTPPTDLPSQLVYLSGQGECAASGFNHWQVVACFRKTVRLPALKRAFTQSTHAEPTRSDAAYEYVHKEATRIAGTTFTLGARPMQRNRATDWDAVLTAAKSGAMDGIPADVVVRCYSNLRRIAADHMQPVGMVREVRVFCGATGTGKSRRAWEEAGMAAYPKDPNSKFWDGYRQHEHVVIDEFRGSISISHMLRWLDRYPVIVEIKGSSVPLCAKIIWITSNLHPKDWYADLDEETKNALLRRLNITVFHSL